MCIQVGKAFSGNKTVTVAKMDATANDVPSDKFSVSSHSAVVPVLPNQEVDCLAVTYVMFCNYAGSHDSSHSHVVMLQQCIV